MKDAIKAAKNNGQDIPVGCVIKLNGKIVASACNRREADGDVTSHAEILAIKEAQKKLGSSRLSECEMYVTLEPCPMCGWAIIQAGIKSLYFGAYNTQYGAMGSVLDLPKIAHSKIKVYSGIEEETCNKILEDFFNKMRKG